MDEEEYKTARTTLGFLVPAAVIVSTTIVIFVLAIFNSFNSDIGIEPQIQNNCVSGTVLQADGSCTPQE